MSASEYVKADPIAFGNSIGALIVAVQGDGIDAGDLKQLLIAVESSAKAMNEMKDVPAAAGLHTISGASEVYGDYLLEKAIAEEAGG
jgi:hypothetical protein